MEVFYKKTNCSDYRSFDYTKLWNQLSTRHQHTSFEILIQLRGNIKNIVNDYARTLIPGNAVLMRPDDWHTIELLKDRQHLHRDIYFSTEKMKNICALLSPDFYNELVKSKEPLYFDIEPNKMQMYEKKLLLFQNKNLDLSVYENLHTCIGFEILSDYIESRIIQSDLYPQWLQNFLSYINSPDNMPLKINDLMKTVNYSREHLSREFRKYMGQTLESYITEQKMNYSLSLLAGTNFSIAFISNQLGYDSQSSFTNNFRKQFGITPIEWRKHHLTLPHV